MVTGENMDGGGMLKPVSGVVGGGIGGGATTSSLRTLSHHHPSFSSLNLSASANSAAPFRANPVSWYDSVFRSVPSRTEVEKAISELRSLILGIRTSGSGWLQQMLQLYNPKMLESEGYGRVSDAFRLLLTEPSVQRMVTSISTDIAVWGAILNNNAVQNLRDSLSTAEVESRQSSGEESDLASVIVKWILDITRAKVLELIENFISLVNLMFQPPAEKIRELSAESSDQVDAKIRSSVLLSVVILLIVVVSRAHGA